MARRRIRFQPGLFVAECLKRYGAETTCAAALERARWPARVR